MGSGSFPVESIMPSRKISFVCDVCSLRFRAAPPADDGEHQTICPRCRSPFVRPVAQKRRSSGGRIGQSPSAPRCMAFS